MALDRESIFAALFARLTEITDFKVTSRTWLGWDEVAAGEQPALVVVKGDEMPISRRGLPPAWKLEAKAIVLVRTVETDPTIAPSTLLNQLITAVEAKLERGTGEVQDPSAGFYQNPDMMFGTTLGGLCTSVLIDGAIITDEGALGNQGVAVIPITLYTAG